MTPEDIVRVFGKEALDMLYDCLLENPVHELANWILAYHTEKQIADWVFNLREDRANG